MSDITEEVSLFYVFTECDQYIVDSENQVTFRCLSVPVILVKVISAPIAQSKRYIKDVVSSCVGCVLR